MPDLLLRATAANGAIRAVAVLTTDLVNDAMRRHGTSYTASAALGKALTGGVLLASTLLKEIGVLNISINGRGPLGPIHVDAWAGGTVRGYLANPGVEIRLTDDGRLDVGAGVGTAGTLSVTHDIGRGHPYTGTVELVTGELGDDFTHYLATSMQTRSAVSLGFLLDKEGKASVAGGFIVQLMPSAVDELAERIEATLQSLPSFSRLYREAGNLEGVLAAALQGFSVELHPTDEMPVFACPCSMDRVLRAIATLGAAEIQDMMAQEQETEVHCKYCNTRYEVTHAQLAQLLDLA